MANVRNGTNIAAKFAVAFGGVSDAAFRLHVEALCWSDANGTNLLIPRAPQRLKMVTYVEDFETAADELVAAEIWRVVGESYDISDPSNRTWHQPTAAIRDARRARERDRKHRQRGGLDIKVMERDDYRCRGCGTTEDLTVDHVFPQILGGSCTGADDDMDNLQTLCRTCNGRKGASVPD